MTLLKSLVRGVLRGRRGSSPRARIVVSHYANAGYWRPKSALFLHVQGGRAGSAHDLGMAGDDTGEHISGRNRNFGELTVMYWAWKNLTGLDIIGFCHYRRYFILDAQFQKNVGVLHGGHDHLEPALTDTAPLLRIARSDVLLTQPHRFERYTIETQYKAKHRAQDFDAMVQTVIEMFPQYGKSHQAFVDGTRLYCCNMFIARWPFFERYMQWLFPILMELESRITVEEGYQRRTLAFMAERLLNWYLIHLQMTERLQIRELGVAFLDQQSWERSRAYF